MPEFTVTSGDATVAAESFGDTDTEPIVLIQGMMGSMLWWREEFCHALAEATGRQVVRYDNRDTGLSTSYPPGSPGYDARAFIADVVAILDELGAERGHIVGISMGGGIAQEVAIQHPDRVATLTALSTSAVSGGPDDLPPPTEEYMAHAASGEGLDYSDSKALADFIARDVLALSGGGRTNDPDEVRAFVKQDIERAKSPESLQNHELLAGQDVGLEAGPESITAPTLVVHGTDDPLLPLPHGEALAELIPGARFLRLEGAGHEIHEQDWPAVIAAIDELISN